MVISAAGRSMIEEFEGVRLTAYQDQRGIWTIGAGHTLGVKEGDICTFEQADQWLAEDLATAEKYVNFLPGLNQNQFDACVSLCFNIGSGNFTHSTVVRDIRNQDFSGASAGFLLWDKTDGEVNPGLQRRRQMEQSLFDTPQGA